MRGRLLSEEKGIILPIVLIFSLVLMITGWVFVSLPVQENRLVQKEITKRQAFYLAEAGVERLGAKLYAGEKENISWTYLGKGRYMVEAFYNEDPPYAISTGQRLKGEKVIAEKKIKVKIPFLVKPYEHGIYSGGSLSQDWIFQLRGTGEPQGGGWWGSEEYGGKDTVYGDIYVNADVNLYEEASVYPPPDPNTYELLGEVNSTGDIIKHPSELDFAGYAPHTNEDVESIPPPDLRGMNYSENNTHDVAQIFDDEGLPCGYLPPGHPLHDVVVKNPSNRSEECSGTTGDDYFFEPSGGFVIGTPKTGETPLNLGEDRIYYVDGDVWFHSKLTYGFEVKGKALIVATGDIHICDNIEYADQGKEGDLLGLVALGKYDEGGELISGGNIYFGDPRYGTTYTVSGFMFAGNNFLYNVDSISGEPQRPDTGFNVFGNWVALNKVSIIRDWYETGHWVGWGQWKWWVSDGWYPAYFDPEDEVWKDLKDDHALTPEELDHLRHYQMKITYDERIRDPKTQPPGLPQGYGSGSIFAGFAGWEEIK